LYKEAINEGTNYYNMTTIYLKRGNKCVQGGHVLTKMREQIITT